MVLLLSELINSQLSIEQRYTCNSISSHDQCASAMKLTVVYIVTCFIYSCETWDQLWTCDSFERAGHGHSVGISGWLKLHLMLSFVGKENPERIPPKRSEIKLIRF